MRLWNAPDQVSTKEIIGRRAFTENIRNGAGYYRIDIFLDERDKSGLSVDRLGIRDADDDVVRCLAELGVALGEKRGRPFAGWAQLKVSDIPAKSKLKVTKTVADGEDNPYHAEIAYADTGVVSYNEAFMLSVLAAKLDFLPAPEIPTPDPPPQQQA
jgi:hypothetical protein